MELLQLSSEQISSTVEVENISGIPVTTAKESKGKAPIPTATMSGDLRFSPLEAAITTKLEGITVPERLIGSSLYARESSGARPWVRSPAKPAEFLDGDPAISNPTGGAPGVFTQLVSVLNDAEGIVEGTPTTVNGIQVDQFTASYPSGEFPVDADPSIQLLVRTLGKPAVELTVFIDSSGLPLRTRLSLNFSKLKLVRTVNIKAINLSFPQVQAPPAKETISSVEYIELLEAKLHKERHKLKQRSAKKQHSK